MPLNETQAAEVLSLMRSSSIEQRVQGIESAQKMFSSMFYEGMDLGEFAKAAQTLENVYNILRDELKQGFKILVEVEVDGVSKQKISTKASKEKGIVKKRSKGPSPEEMMSKEFMADIFGLSKEDLQKRLEEKKV